MTVIGADLVEAPADLSGGWELDAFLPLPSTSATLTTLTPASNNNSDNSDDDNDDNDNTIHSQRSAATLTELSLALYQGVARVLEDTASPGLSVIVCAAGGWQGDPAATALHQQHDTDDASQDVQAAAAVLQSMMDVNLLPALATALTVQHCRTPTGPTLVVFMGATAALNATPGMLGYGVSKAATHHVVSTLAAALPATAKNRSGGGASTTTVVGILPTTLDTPGNRVANPGADTSTWTPPSALSRKIGDWWKRPSLRPHSGALVKVHQSRAGESIFELVR
jgi:dihydropteridine reductase